MQFVPEGLSPRTGRVLGRLFEVQVEAVLREESAKSIALEARWWRITTKLLVREQGRANETVVIHFENVGRIPAEVALVGGDFEVHR